MGLGVLVAGIGANWIDGGTERLSLAPYVEPPPAGSVGVFGDQLRAMGAFENALLAGLVAVLFFLVVEAIVRRTWDHAHETAALLPAVLFAVLPAQLAFQRIIGTQPILVGLGVLFLGAWLALGRHSLLAVLGAGLAAVAACVHPAMLVLAPAVVGCLWLGGTLRSIPAACAAAAAVVAVAGIAVTGSISADPALAGMETSRSGWALDLLAASPVYAFWSDPRDLLPTGYAAMRGDLWPIAAGLAIWGLLVGWSMLTTGIVRTAMIVAFAALAGAAPFVVPAWVPGDRAVALLPVPFALLLVAHLLSVVRGSTPQLIGISAAVAITCVGIGLPRMDGSEGHDRLRSRQDLLIPELGGSFSIAGEADPVRLLLFGLDSRRQLEELRKANENVGSWASYPASVADQIAVRLAVPDPPVLDAPKVRLLAKVLRDPIDASLAESGRFERLDKLQVLIREINEELRQNAPRDCYSSVQTRVQALIGDAMQISYALREKEVSHPRFRRFLSSFMDLARTAAKWATELGDLHYSVPLREVLVELTTPVRAPVTRIERQGYLPHWEARALLGIELAEMKRFDEARTHLAAAIPWLAGSGSLGAVARAALSRVDLAGGADPIDVLDGLSAAWSGLAGAHPSAQGLPGILRPSTRDYWLVAEFLLHRYELVNEHDPTFEPQARRDIHLALAGPAADERIRRVPALAFWGRLNHLRGQKETARRALLEMRAVKPKRFGERGSGTSGYLDTPRFRLGGLRTLLKVLDPAADGDLIAAVQGEIAALDRY